MKIKSMKLALFALCGLMLLPQSASAYEVTDSSAVRLDDTTLLFTISYKFGFLNRDMATPIFASRQDSADDKVGYTMIVNGEEAHGTMGAVVLTTDEDVSTSNGQYVLPERENAIFTLVGIVRTDTPIMNAQMQITKLPFITYNGTEARLSGLTDTELLEYRSPTLLITDAGTISIKTSVGK